MEIDYFTQNTCVTSSSFFIECIGEFNSIKYSHKIDERLARLSSYKKEHSFYHFWMLDRELKLRVVTILKKLSANVLLLIFYSLFFSSHSRVPTKRDVDGDNDSSWIYLQCY